MKVDVVTTFPKAALETEKVKSGEPVRDYGAIDEFVHLNAHITSYKRLLSGRSVLKNQVVRCIDQTHGAIVDSAKRPLDDYIVVVDENVNWEGADPPNPASVDLITYFLNLNEVDARLGLDFAKAVLLPDGREDRYINNCAIPWDQNSPWVLPIEQSSQVEVRLDTQVEGVVERALCTVHETRIETYEKIMTAIALFNQSCRLSLFSPNSSVVLIVSALEALFEMPDIGKTQVFPYIMQVHWGFDKDVKKWAEELYKLRSAIVHGGAVGKKKRKPSPDRYYSHYEIARKVFDDCLRLVLELRGAVSISSDDKSAMRKRLLGLVVSNKKKIENVIALLKRIISYKSKNVPEEQSLCREFFDIIETLDPEDDSATGCVVPYLNAVFSLVLDWVGFEREEMESLPSSNTKFGLQQRMPYYDKIAGIIGQIRTVGSWSGGKLSEAGELRLNSHIIALLQVTTGLKGLATPSRMMFSMMTFEEFLERCLRAIKSISGSGK